MTPAQKQALLDYIDEKIIDNISEEILPEQVHYIMTELANDLFAKAIPIPTPKVETVGLGEYEVRTNQILLSWPESENTEFLQYNPKFLIFRYKQGMKSVKRDGITDETVKNKISSRWAHPRTEVIRTTEWAVDVLPFPKKTAIAFNHLEWFWLHEAKVFTVSTIDGDVQKGPKTFLPKGLKPSYAGSGSPILNENIRKNMFARFAIEITIEGKKYVGGFSNILKIGYTRTRTNQADIIYNNSLDIYIDNYSPTIQVL
jgi:hypothetical protein